MSRRCAPPRGPAGACDESVIEVAVRGTGGSALPMGVRIQRMTHLDSRVQWNLGPPRVRYPEAVLDVAWRRPATGLPSAWSRRRASRAGRRRSSCATRCAAGPGSRRRATGSPRCWPTWRTAPAPCSSTATSRESNAPTGCRAPPVSAGPAPRWGSSTGTRSTTSSWSSSTDRLCPRRPPARDRDMQRDLDAAAEGWTPCVRLLRARSSTALAPPPNGSAVLLRRHGWRGTPRALWDRTVRVAWSLECHRVDTHAPSSAAGGASGSGAGRRPSACRARRRLGAGAAPARPPRRRRRAYGVRRGPGRRRPGGAGRRR